MSSQNNETVLKAKYTIRSKRHVRLSIPSGQIDVWMKNPDFNLKRAAIEALWIFGFFEDLKKEGLVPAANSSLRTSEKTESWSETPDRCHKSSMKPVRKILLRQEIPFLKIKRDACLIVIRERIS